MVQKGVSSINTQDQIDCHICKLICRLVKFLIGFELEEIFFGCHDFEEEHVHDADDDECVEDGDCVVECFRERSDEGFLVYCIGEENCI